MAIAHNEVDFELSGGAANTDPLLSFGGAKSGTSIHEFQSTLTANQPADRSLFQDSSRIGDGDDAHNDKFVLFVGGAANLSAHRVIDFRSSDGLFTLEGRTAGAALSGDFYRVFAIDSLWHELTESECASGHTDYRLVYVQNDSVNDGTSVSFYLYRLIPTTGWADCDFEIMARNTPSIPEGTPPNHEVGPTITNPRVFTQPATFNDINRQPRVGTNVDLASGQFRGCWLKRIVPSNARRNPYAVMMLVHEFTDDASAQIRVGCLLPFGLLGFTPSISIAADRGPGLSEGEAREPYDNAIYVGSGARFTAEVRAQETGLIVPCQEIGWSETGDGSLWLPDFPVTDDDGLASVTYHAPAAGILAQESFTIGVSSNPTFDAATLNNKSDVSWAHTVTSGSNRALIVAVSAASVTETADEGGAYGRTLSVLCEGLEMERIGHNRIGSAFIELWYFLSPPVGSCRIAIEFASEVERLGAGAIQIDGVNLRTPLDALRIFKKTDDDSSTSFDMNITTVTDNALLLDFYNGFYPGQLFPTVGGGQTEQMLVFVGSSFIARGSLSTKPTTTAGIQTVSRTSLTAGQDRLGIVTALRPALASATVKAKV